MSLILRISRRRNPKPTVPTRVKNRTDNNPNMAPKKRKAALVEPKAATVPKLQKPAAKPSEPVDEVFKYDCKTCVKIEKIHYVWKISNFGFFHDRRNKMMLSPEFKAKSNENVVWRLRLKPRTGEDKNQIGLFLVLDSCDKHDGVVGKFTLAVLNAKGEEKISRSTEHTFTKEADDWGYDNFMTRDYLFNQANNVLPNDELTFLCDLEFASPDTIIHATKHNLNYVDVPECNITEDFENLLKNESFSDITLSVDGKDFLVHKAVLAARSSVFAAMFRHEMKESNSNRVEIADIDKEVFEELLRYIYTGKVNNLKDVVYNLLVAANKYDLERLKNMCEADLCKRLDVENAIEILLWADMHNLQQLKKRAIDFIKTCLSDVMSTSMWNDMISNHPNLINEIFAALATNEKK